MFHPTPSSFLAVRRVSNDLMCRGVHDLKQGTSATTDADFAGVGFRARHVSSASARSVSSTLEVRSLTAVILFVKNYCNDIHKSTLAPLYMRKRTPHLSKLRDLLRRIARIHAPDMLPELVLVFEEFEDK